MRVWQGGKSNKRIIHYDDHVHRSIPHVVKFSGGRSSGLMLLTLLENELLSAARGDVVLFTNTSAEHPITYNFVSKIKRATENKGIPFFIAQFQTYETVISGQWRRRNTYRLVNDNPFSKKNLYGYNYRGEVFEESIAWTGMLPSVHTRVCTTLLKMFVTREFLSDWFAGSVHIQQQGHDAGASQIDPNILFRIYLQNGGTMSREQFELRHRFLARRPTCRPQQKFRDFSKVFIPNQINKHHFDSVVGNKCMLFGEDSAPFLTFLGFRAGETERYQRMMLRNLGEATPGHATHPTNEHSYAPLYNLGIDQKNVTDFWAKQASNIRPYLPTDMNLSNCVYCFLKGTQALTDINKNKIKLEKKLPPTLNRKCRNRLTPNSISWWDRIEQEYGRQSNKKSLNGNGHQQFGMFGLDNLSYKELKLHRKSKRINSNGNATNNLPLQSSLTCECTD